MQQTCRLMHALLYDTLYRKAMNSQQASPVHSCPCTSICADCQRHIHCSMKSNAHEDYHGSSDFWGRSHCEDKIPLLRLQLEDCIEAIHNPAKSMIAATLACDKARIIQFLHVIHAEHPCGPRLPSQILFEYHPELRTVCCCPTAQATGPNHVLLCKDVMLGQMYIFSVRFP